VCFALCKAQVLHAPLYLPMWSDNLPGLIDINTQ